MNLFFLNSFTSDPFGGNPAAVCLLEKEQDDLWMQKVAKQTSQPVTAFIHVTNDGYDLRWFTPVKEINLCGHGTLASAFVLWQKGVVNHHAEIRFHTKSGILTARLSGDWIEIAFPIIPFEPEEAPKLLNDGLGVKPLYAVKSMLDYILELESEAEVRAADPNIELLSQLPVRAVVVTSRSDSNHYDYVSRFFSPSQGIKEDQVNGSSHCSLGPYWKSKLNKTEFAAYQASERGGELKIKVEEERVLISGQAVLVFEGEAFFDHQSISV
ncbi:PhzF family phenazine biosynthesis protein [Fictibacillus enclensis]|uniref:PhzF family phenazine biosynthesis protein n=1 Tax=Fictibacillus enclensis TaxID=1017270 RepID=UPI0024C0AC15|nr:PhzF family phenazine biosynthesis protein [Fictibacillus enclensis]WHY72933.1 PhzF family phenazine biosynthesis protein [Fictibacillus enclensis]